LQLKAGSTRAFRGIALFSAKDYADRADIEGGR